MTATTIGRQAPAPSMTSTTSTTSTTAPVGVVIAGVDTHQRTHHVAVIDSTGAQLGDREFPASSSGYTALLAFVIALAGTGGLERVGVESTGSYGAGLAGTSPPRASAS